jgi:hypothetical protein
MGQLSQLAILGFADGVNFVAEEGVNFLPVNQPLFIVVGIGLIIATLIIIFFLKKIIINSVLGGIIWAIAIFVFKVNLPTIPSLIVSIVIGPAGIGTMLLLNALGLLAV